MDKAGWREPIEVPGELRNAWPRRQLPVEGPEPSAVECPMQRRAVPRGGAVPEISRFLGIVIMMFYNDHEPPHFHARYGPHESKVLIADGTSTGDLPRRVLGLVLEWYTLHRAELREDWERARARKPLARIAPLE